MINPNDPAFHRGNFIAGINEGLTKREYFAGLALQGLYSATAGDTPRDVIKIAVQAADALIDELNKPVEVKP